MNTLQSRYAQHVKDVYDINNATIPQVEQEELSALITSITRQVQPLLLRDAIQRRIDDYKAREGEQAELRLWDERRGIINLSYEVTLLGNLSKGIDRKVKPLVERLSKSLELEGIVDVASDRGLNLEALRKVLKTAYWLNRNL